MALAAYPFRIGSLACAAVSDGVFNYPLASMFAGVPEAECAAALRQRGLPDTQIPSPYICLYIQAGPRRILVDTGMGGLWTHAPGVFPGLDHSTTHTGELVDSLRSIGVDPAEIDTVVITHAHPDHVNGELVLAFHFAPFPGLGHVTKVEGAWRWEPIAAQA
jgi:glyoxylase-like metal-dependent hydrolase (beta-lactamase superfamily II)